MKKKKLHPEWCPIFMLQTNKEYERCPKCNKRLKVLFYDCESRETKLESHKKDNKGVCVHPYLPKHKDKRNK